MTAQVRAAKARTADPIPSPLAKPSVRQALNNISLNPMAVHTTGRLTAEIKRVLLGLLETDTFSVKLTGWNSAEPRGSYTSPTLPFGLPTLRALNLEASVVAFNLGQKIQVEYTVNRVGETSESSEKLELNVLDLPQEELKVGVIFGTDDDGSGPELDLTTDTGDRTARVDLWPLTAVGQWCWIVLKGKKADGSDYETTLFKGQIDQESITRGHIEVPVYYDELKALSNRTTLTMEYKIAFDQVDDESRAHVSQVRIYSIKSAVAGKPEIIAMTDLNGVEIHNGGGSSTLGVILKGTAAAGQEVRIFRGRAVIDRVNADDEGTWEYEFNHRDGFSVILSAKTPDDSYSVMWRVWFAAEGRPIITRLTDSKGEPIPEYGATFDSTVMVTGTATPGEEVKMIHMPTRIPVDIDGVWRLTWTGLSTQQYNVTAHALYGQNLQSYSWPIHVVEVGTPVITSFTDSLNRIIPFSGYTLDRTIKLNGTASADGHLVIFLGTTPCDLVKVDADGAWNCTLLLPPSDGFHYFRAQALYGAGAQSPQVRMTVTSTAAIDPDDADGELNTAQ